MRIALIGCGAIGRALLELLRAEPAITVAAIVVPQAHAAATQALARELAPEAAVAAAVPSRDIDLVVEAAGHAAIAEHVVPAVAHGRPAIVVSVGALADAGLLGRLEAAARQGRTQVQLVPGAIGGLDALAAARFGGLDSVHYTGRKPPLAWQGTPAEAAFDLGSLTEATVIFEGSAREAASLYPKNANVAATVALAGLGLDRTRVRLIADPAAGGNLHEIDAEGGFGQLALRLRNRPLPANPKTSALAVYSAARALLGRVAPLNI